MITSDQYKSLLPYNDLLVKISLGRTLTSVEKNFPEVFMTVYADIYRRVNNRPYKQIKGSSCRSCGGGAMSYARRLARYYMDYKHKNNIV